MIVTFTLNGEEREVDQPPLKRLLDYLREEALLTAIKEGCGEGECGACAVLIDGDLINSCLVPLAQVQGRNVLTPEGLKDSPQGQCLTDAFARAGAVQCGYCTPGMMMAAQALLLRQPQPTKEAIRIGLSGNLCRCTGYNMIIEGVRLAAEESRRRQERGGEALW